MTTPLEFFVVENDEADPVPDRLRVIRLGADVRINAEQFRLYLARQLQAEDIDILVLTGVVARVDRTVRRKPSIAWARQLHIHMRVHDPSHWDRREVQSALACALRILTGDEWSFEFHQRKNKDESLQQQ